MPTKPKPYVAAYMRISTTNGRQSTSSQRHALKNYVKAHKLTRRTKWYEDKASGRSSNREALNAILEDCEAGRCDTLILWKLDRLSRSCRQTLNLLADLADQGVKVVIVSQGLELDNSIMGRAMVQLMGLVAELESNFISERVSAGLAHAKERGVRLGRPTNEKKRQQLSKWLAKGVSCREIAKRWNVSPASVYAMRKRIAAS